MSLIKYEESIAVVTSGSFEDINDEQLELWVMKEYGVDSSWTMVLHSIDENGKLVFYASLNDVFGVRKNGEVLLTVYGKEEEKELATLSLSCHQQEHKQQPKRLIGKMNSLYDVFVGSYLESLVLLDKGEKDNYLPPEIITLILQRLPVKSAVKCTAVCKTWYALIKHPSFISNHLQQAASLRDDLLLLRFTRDDKEFYQLRRDNDAFEEYKQFHVPFECGGFGVFRIVGTCNGLICLADIWSNSCKFILWNPSIHKHFTLPKIDFTYILPDETFLGFGFDSASDDYKVLLVVARGYNEDLTEVWLFSLNRNSWTWLSEVCPKHSCGGVREAAFVRGVLHWPGFLHHLTEVWLFSLNRNSWTWLSEVCPKHSCGGVREAAFVRGVLHWPGFLHRRFFSNMILAFDLSTEKFHVMNYPKTLVQFAPQMSLIKYEESIAVVTTGSFEDIDDEQHELWVMKEYGVDSSWTMVLHSIDENGKLVFDASLHDVFGVRKNGEVLLTVHGKDREMELATLNLNCHQQEHKQQPKRLIGNGNDFYKLFVGSYLESLVLLDKGEKDTEGQPESE
ncbi:unnamed protein product [Cuscuta campestris]|uniref:F-box domain-containing protein n=1 Tax=Cuscuta campestris TaxID=132261 RepID=A0A484L603_9ASTE|nr:unnamed protein product [Cuscuta campestris]